MRPLFQVWNDCNSPPRSAIAWKRTVHARSVMLLSIGETHKPKQRERSRRRRFSKPPISKQVDNKEISSPSRSQSTLTTDTYSPTRYSKLHNIIAVFRRYGDLLDIFNEIIPRFDYTSHSLPSHTDFHFALNIFTLRNIFHER